MPPARDIELPTMVAIPPMLVPAGTLVLLMPNYVLNPHSVMKQEPDEFAVYVNANKLENVEPEILASKMLKMLFAHPAMAMRVRLELAKRRSNKLKVFRKMKYKDARVKAAAKKKDEMPFKAVARNAAAATADPAIAAVPDPAEEHEESGEGDEEGGAEGGEEESGEGDEEDEAAAAEACVA